MLAIGLFACSQIAAARREEAEQRLETMFALSVGRRAWMTGRLMLAAAASSLLAITARLLAWGGAASQGADVSLPRLLEAGANCIPAALLFLGLGALGFAIWPRASVGIAYGLVSVTFMWQLVGSLLGLPRWTLSLSPFDHVGPVPVQPLRTGEAVAMLAVAAAAAVAAVRLFERRDLVGP